MGTERATTHKDRVGLGWRPELAAGIFANQDRIDVLEVIAEDWFDAPRHKISALKTLAAQIPLQLHGTSAGLTSAVPVEGRRIAKMARLVDLVQPEAWSEHLAFVRGGGIEIGHLAASPRTTESVESAAENIYRANELVGVTPMVENIATLIDPPASTLSEVEWLSEVIGASAVPLLLDLHNLYANAVNFGGDPAIAPFDALRCLPLDCVGTVHIAGGRWVAGGEQFPGQYRLLDDHLNPVPDMVYALLEELAARTLQPLTVILERDGAYSAMEDLLFELDKAREALQRGRERRISASAAVAELREEPVCGPRSSQLEIVLARLYTDEVTRAEFLLDPTRFARGCGLASHEVDRLASVDRVGLEMVARSFARKRESKEKGRGCQSLFERMLGVLSRPYM